MRISLWLCLVQQTLCALAVLAAAGRIGGLPRAHPGRLIAASVLGGLLALAGLMGPRPLRLALLLPALLLPKLIWPGLTRRGWLRLLLPQLLLMLAFDGMAGLGAQWVPLTISAALGLLLLMLLPAWQKRQPQVLYAALHIEYEGRTSRFIALIDSGNLLLDHITGLPVIVLSQSAAHRITEPPKGDELLPGMRYLRIRTAAGPACMPVFHADLIRLEAQGCCREVDALLGISPDASAGFTALVPSCLLFAAEQEGGISDVHDI